MIIDGDGHVAEPMTVWTDYLPAEWYPRFHHGRDATGVEYVLCEDKAIVFDPKVLPYSYGDSMTPRGLSPEHRRFRPFEEGHPGGFDPAERLRLHAAEGIDAAVLFTTLGLWAGSIRDPALAVAVCRALNRWLGDYCSSAPTLLHGVATLPVQDPAAAAEELRRCVDEHRFVAGTFRPNPQIDGTLVSDPKLDRVWQEATELGVPICLHGGANGWQPFVGAGRVRSHVVSHIIDHAFEQMLAFGSMYESGVFERFPHVRVGFMESSAAWAPFWLDRLDEHVETWGFELPPEVERSPAEVFHDQCVIGGEGEERMIPYVQDRLGLDKVLWASDYPHFDCRVPGLAAAALDRRDLSDSQRDAFLGGAAADFYRLDTAAIAEAAGRS